MSVGSPLEHENVALRFTWWFSAIRHPAHAGIQVRFVELAWIPASTRQNFPHENPTFAGMTPSGSLFVLIPGTISKEVRKGMMTGRV